MGNDVGASEKSAIRNPQSEIQGRRVGKP